MIKFYDVNTGVSGFNAQTISEQFLPTVSLYTERIEELYNDLIEACRDAGEKYSLCDFGEVVSNDYYAISNALNQAKYEFTSQMESANNQVASYVDNIRAVEKKIVESTEDTAALINNIKNRDYTKLYEDSLKQKTSLEDDILDSIEFKEDTSIASLNGSNTINDEPILESIDYSEFSSQDED